MENIENAKKYIYVLLLEKNKIFLHASNSLDANDIFNEFKLLFDYSLKYPPLKILDSIMIFPSNKILSDSCSHSTNNLIEKNPTIFLLNIDKYVKQYMILYGIDNVRGGNYSDEFLDENTLDFLKKELNINKLNNQKVLLEQYYEFKKNTQIDKKFNYEKYIVLKNKYSKLKKFNNNKIFNEEILKELEWLCEISKESGHFTYREAPENKERYKNIVLLIKQLLAKYEEILEERYEEKKNSPYFIFMKNPEFLFDNFFYHQKKNFRPFLSEQDGEKIWQLFELLYYSIYNRLQELEFDLSYFPEDLEELIAIKNRDLFHTPESEKEE